MQIVKMIAKTVKKIIFPYENDIIFTSEDNSKKGEVIRQKTQNNTFYLTGITPSRGNYNIKFFTFIDFTLQQ